METQSVQVIFQDDFNTALFLGIMCSITSLGNNNEGTNGAFDEFRQ